MAKINLDLASVTEADIISQMNKIEAMIEGRMDEDNIHQVAGKITALGKASVNDIADNGNPVYADKFLAQSESLDGLYSSEAVNFKTDVFDKIKNFAWYADRFTVLSKKGTITLNYKNQENLEKPSVIISGSDEGLSLAAQRSIIGATTAQRERAYYDYLHAPEDVGSIGEQLLTIFYTATVGAFVGLVTGGPIGMAIGAISGAAAGAGVIGGVQAYRTAQEQGYDDSYDPYKETIQIMVYKHPSNFRPVSMLEFTDLLSQYSNDDIRYNDLSASDSTLSRNDLFSKNLYAISAKTSIENELANNSQAAGVQISQPMLIDAETTVVVFSVLPYVGSWDDAGAEELISSVDAYVTALCEVDILFRIIA